LNAMTYKIIEIFTREEVRWHGSPLYDAIVHLVADQKSAARCVVTRAVAGCFENGEVASHRIIDISFNMPLKIEIILPPAELDRVLPKLEEMVTDGIIVVEESEIRLHRTGGGLLPRSLRVRDVMTSSPVSVRPTDSLRDVLGILVRAEFDAVPVTDVGGRLVGMVSQVDLMEKGHLHTTPGILAALWQGAEAERLPADELLPAEARSMVARDVMTSRTETIGVDDKIADAVKTMTRANLKRMPVLDKDKRLVGMLSRIDILRAASVGSSRRQVCESYGVGVPGNVSLGQACLLDVPAISPGTSARQVLGLIDQEARRVVVVDDGRVPLGIISDRDLLPLLDPKHQHRIDELSAADLMRTVPTMRQDSTVEDALSWMVEHRRQRLPVVDDEGRYVGVLSREELLRILSPEQ
jgi:CBS domain-containing protein